MESSTSLSLSHTLAIKTAGSGDKLFNPAIIAWRLNGETAHSRTFVSGQEQGELVVLVIEIVQAIAPGAALHIITDHKSFWGAFPEANNWLETWRRGGFKRKPSAFRNEWKALSEAMEGMTVSAAAPRTKHEHEMLEELKVFADQHDERAPKEPKPSKWRNPGARTVEDDLRQRAMDKDKDPD